MPACLPAERLSRSVGFLPLLVSGAWGTLMPRKLPMHVVVGRPIPVPKVHLGVQQRSREACLPWACWGGGCGRCGMGRAAAGPPRQPASCLLVPSPVLMTASH